MIKNTLLFLLITIPLVIFSQSISKQVIAPLGANLANNTNKLSYTLGETIVGPMYAENGSVQLGNGYYPSLNIETLSIQSPTIAIRLKVYPNPVNENLFISHPTETNVDVFLSDINGKKLFDGKVQKQTPINMEQYPKGIYLLTTKTGETKKTNTYKLIKK
ncbi:T9SS type A sorting domain-containing protein [Flavobacteriaceae bacterium]|nr:T9SS type A sorting domain-containing protein [Flavobacteriaceae bacterium]